MVARTGELTRMRATSGTVQTSAFSVVTEAVTKDRHGKETVSYTTVTSGTGQWMTLSANRQIRRGATVDSGDTIEDMWTLHCSTDYSISADTHLIRDASLRLYDIISVTIQQTVIVSQVLTLRRRRDRR